MKLKIEFWYFVLWLGSFLEYVGEHMHEKGSDKLDEIDRNHPETIEYQRKRGMVP